MTLLSPALADASDTALAGLPTPESLVENFRTVTEQKAVMANHTRVEIASEAAVVTSVANLRKVANAASLAISTLVLFAMEVTTAAKMSGGPITWCSWT